MNCWEYMDCGRELGGAKVSELGVCPAALDEDVDGLNNGQNGGRFCWAIAGTFCGDRVQGTAAEKQTSCFRCDFFQLVKKEEGSDNFLMTIPGCVF